MIMADLAPLKNFITMRSLLLRRITGTNNTEHAVVLRDFQKPMHIILGAPLFVMLSDPYLHPA